MKTAHTPGLWKAAQAFQNNGPNYWVVSNGKWKSPVIATIASEGDARLIASAPELAEALRGLFKNCAMVHNSWGDGCNQKEADAFIIKARTLLARIDGEAATP